MADEITEEQYQAEVLDYEEAHRKLNEQLTTIMENTMVWERALSLRNPWIQQMEQYKTPEALDRNFVKKYIEQVVVTFLGDRQAEISLTMKTEEWKQMLERIELETSVRHMLANQTYVGDTINNKSTQRFFAGQDKRDLSKEQWYVAKNTHPAIIARDDFEKVQEILTKNQKVFKTVRAESEQIRTEYQNDLTGMVFCADCGRSMDFDRLPHGAEESKKVCYYICRARQADDKCIGHQITEKLLKALVMDQLHLFIVRLSDKRKVLEELRKIEDMQNPVYRAKSEIMSLTDKVSQMAKKREQLYADYVAGVVDSEDYQLIREDYSKQYDGLRAALQRAEAKKVEVEQQIREYLNMTSNLEEHLDDFGFDAQLVKSLVQRIEVSADKRIRIVFGFQDVFADLGKESAGK